MALGKKTYFKDCWNVIDFAIVLGFIIEMVCHFAKINTFSLRPLRTLRVLRPLKGLKTIPSMRKQVTAMISSIIGLVNVAFFLLFIFFLYGILYLQWFSGFSHYACRKGLHPGINATVWEKVGQEGICTPLENQLFSSLIDYVKCDEGSTCGSPLDHGLSLLDDGLYSNMDN